VGVNAAIASSSGGFEGIGFAIPSNMALYISRELIAKGKVERGWLGVSVQDLSYDLSKTMGVEGTRGALVSEVSRQARRRRQASNRATSSSPTTARRSRRLAAA